MNDFFDKIKKVREGIFLRSERKREIRENLLRFLDAREAVRERDLSRHIIQRSFLNKLGIKKPMPIFAAIALVALLGGGTSFAAQGALPGDVLYPVKVNVNEEVRAALTFSSEGKTELNAERAAVRLDEAEKLAAQNRLTAQAKAQVEENFIRFADKVKDKLAELPPQARADIVSRFEAALAAHDRILLGLAGAATSTAASTTSTSTATSSVSVEVRDLKLKVRNVLEDISREREDAESEVADDVPNVRPAAEGRIGAAENVIASASKFLDARDASSSVNLAQAQAKLQSASDLLAQAKVKLAAQAYADAFRLASQAIRTAQEARVEVQSSTKLELREEHDDDDEDIRATSSASSSFKAEHEDDDDDDEDEVRAASTPSSSLNAGEREDGEGRGNGKFELNLGL